MMEEYEASQSEQGSEWNSVAALAGKMGELGINSESIVAVPLQDFASQIGMSRVAISDFFKKQSKAFIKDNGKDVENPFILSASRIEGQRGRGNTMLTPEQQHYYLTEKIDAILATRKRLEMMEKMNQASLGAPPEGYKTQKQFAKDMGMSEESVKHFFRDYDLGLYTMEETKQAVVYLSPEQQDEYKAFRSRKIDMLGDDALTNSRIAKELGGLKQRVINAYVNNHRDYIFGETGQVKVDKINYVYTEEQYKRLREGLIEFIGEKRRANFPESAIAYYLESTGVNYERRHRPDWMKNEETGYNWEIDLYLPDYNVGIEYDGFAFHKETLEHDYQKDQLALNRNGTKVFHVREAGLPSMKEGMLGVERDYNYSKTDLSVTLNKLFSIMGIDIPQGVDVKRDADGIDKIMEERLAYMNFGINATLAVAGNVNNDIELKKAE